MDGTAQGEGKRLHAGPGAGIQHLRRPGEANPKVDERSVARMDIPPVHRTRAAMEEVLINELPFSMAHILPAI